MPKGGSVVLCVIVCWATSRTAVCGERTTLVHEGLSIVNGTMLGHLPTGVLRVTRMTT